MIIIIEMHKFQIELDMAPLTPMVVKWANGDAPFNALMAPLMHPIANGANGSRHRTVAIGAT